MKSIANKLKKLANQDMVAYKVMKVVDGNLVSGADARQNIPLKKGTVLKFRYPGVYLTLDKQYALYYYSGLAEYEALIKVSFDPENLTKGNLTDKETEFSVYEGILIGWELL